MAASQITPFPLGAIGAAGMNTQQSAIDLEPQFATLALNCYADEAGRPTARKSAQLETTSNVDLGTGPVYRCFRHNKADGTSVQLLAGGGCIFTSNGTTVTTRTTGYLNDYWQFASLNGKAFGVKASTSGIYYNESTWASSSLATPGSVQFKSIYAAFGRLWAVTDTTLYWSDLLDGTNFSTGASGSMALDKLHTEFKDVAVAVVAFNRQIVVLCKKSIYVLGLASDLNPNNTTAPIFLRENISNIGCYARDSVVSTGDDVLFLATDGVRSLSRSLSEQQGPAPMTDISALNKNYVVSNLIAGNAADAITAAWNPEKSWYMIFGVTTKEVYLFDMGQRVPGTQLPRMFVWTFTTNPLYCGLWWTDDEMHFGSNAGMFLMDTYNVADEYTMTVTTGWLSLGDASRLDVYKRFMVNLSGGSGQTATLKWSVDFLDSERSKVFTLESSQAVYEFNVTEFTVGEFSSGGATAELYVNVSGAGKVIKFSLDFPISGAAITINNAIAFSKQGRIR